MRHWLRILGVLGKTTAIAAAIAPSAAPSAASDVQGQALVAEPEAGSSSSYVVGLAAIAPGEQSPQGSGAIVAALPFQSLALPQLPDLDRLTPIPAHWWTQGSLSPLAIVIGHAEGTRTLDGAPTLDYYWHLDPGNGADNFGSFSFQHFQPTEQQAVAQEVTGEAKRWMAARQALPELADARQLQRLQAMQDRLLLQAHQRGLRLSVLELLSGLDLANQSEAAALDTWGYVDRLAQMRRLYKDPLKQIKEARTWSYWHPRLNRWDAPGLGNHYKAIHHDQSRRVDAIAAALKTVATQLHAEATLANLKQSPTLALANPTPPISDTSEPAPLPMVSAPIANVPLTSPSLTSPSLTSPSLTSPSLVSRQPPSLVSNATVPSIEPTSIADQPLITADPTLMPLATELPVLDSSVLAEPDATERPADRSAERPTAPAAAIAVPASVPLVSPEAAPPALPDAASPSVIPTGAAPLNPSPDLIPAAKPLASPAPTATTSISDIPVSDIPTSGTPIFGTPAPESTLSPAAPKAAPQVEPNPSGSDRLPKNSTSPSIPGSALNNLRNPQPLPSQPLPSQISVSPPTSAAAASSLPQDATQTAERRADQIIFFDPTAKPTQ